MLFFWAVFKLMLAVSTLQMYFKLSSFDTDSFGATKRMAFEAFSGAYLVFGLMMLLWGIKTACRYIRDDIEW